MNRKILGGIVIIILITASLLVGCSTDILPSQTSGSGDNTPTVQPTIEPASNTIEPSPAVSPEESSTGGWTVVLDTQISHETYIEGFLNEKHGITVGYGGEIHYTNDGGKTWPKGENKSMCRYCLDIVDEDVSWCSGNGNQVRVTRDGGKTWTAVSDINLLSAHSNIDFLDDTTGWISTLTSCAATKDGGVTWTELTLHEDSRGIAAICLRTPQDAYILKYDGLFFTTSDGGDTWSKKDLGFSEYGIFDKAKNPGLNKSKIALADISFSDEDNGLIVFTDLDPDKTSTTWCMTTSDGGTTWEAEKLSTPDGFSPEKVFISGDGKYLTLGNLDKRLIVMKREQTGDDTMSGEK
ncbi:MAG: hypothetical protein GX115_13870 [Ruminiclostridium sp.]|nr:hypothetical protein [Ruminiclostridium sp.]